jgi:hypothetical protein
MKLLLIDIEEHLSLKIMHKEKDSKRNYRLFNKFITRTSKEKY